MIFSFQGHPNILSTHRNTIEFTKDHFLTRNGDCIVGINSEFDPSKLKEIVKQNNKIKLIIEVGNHRDTVIADSNKHFSDEHEIVIRKTNFNSNRTLGVNANKAAIAMMGNSDQIFNI